MKLHLFVITLAFALLVTACAKPADDITVVDTGARSEARTTYNNTSGTVINVYQEQPNTVVVDDTPDVVVQNDATVRVVRTVAWESGEQERNEEIAAQYIRSRGTYEFDGSNLRLTDTQKRATNPPLLVYTFMYESRFGGYGDRDGQVVTEAVTPHTVRVVIMNGDVVSAITDNTWNEMTQHTVSTSGTNRLPGDPCGGAQDYTCAGDLYCFRESDEAMASGYCVDQA
jgi:hypothetical protein